MSPAPEELIVKSKLRADGCGQVRNSGVRHRRMLTYACWAPSFVPSIVSLGSFVRSFQGRLLSPKFSHLRLLVTSLQGVAVVFYSSVKEATDAVAHLHGKRCLVCFELPLSCT